MSTLMATQRDWDGIWHLSAAGATRALCGVSLVEFAQRHQLDVAGEACRPRCHPCERLLAIGGVDL